MVFSCVPVLEVGPWAVGGVNDAQPLHMIKCRLGYLQFYRAESTRFACYRRLCGFKMAFELMASRNVVVNRLGTVGLFASKGLLTCGTVHLLTTGDCLTR